MFVRKSKDRASLEFHVSSLKVAFLVGLRRSEHSLAWAYQCDARAVIEFSKYLGVIDQPEAVRMHAEVNAWDAEARRAEVSRAEAMGLFAGR